MVFNFLQKAWTNLSSSLQMVRLRFTDCFCCSFHSKAQHSRLRVQSVLEGLSVSFCLDWSNAREVRFGAKVWPLVLKILKSFFLISCNKPFRHAEFTPWRIPWTENRGSHFAVICSGGTNLVCSGSPKATETLTCPAQTRRADAANAGSVPSSCTNVPPSPLCMSSRGHEAKLH
jgi:hypothetical protein